MHLIAPTLVGNEHARQYLRLLIERETARGSFLFVGPEGVGKRAVARAFGRALQCAATPDRRPCGTCGLCRAWNHGTNPDALIVRRAADHAAIRLEQIRPTANGTTPAQDTIHRRLQLRSVVGPRQVVIIEDADRLNDAAASALLKTLEEPRGDTILILTTSALDAVPRTVRSRCTLVYFHRVPTAVIRDALRLERRLTTPERELIASLADGRPDIAHDLAHSPERLAGELDAFATLLRTLQGSTQRPFGLSEAVLPTDRKASGPVATATFRRLALIVHDVLMVTTGAPSLIRLKRFRVALERLAAGLPEQPLHQLADFVSTLPALLDQNVSPKNILDRFTNQFAAHAHPR